MSNLPVRSFAMPRGQELTDLINFCKIMAESKFYRNLGAGGVMSIVLTAKELNLPMMPCLNGGMYNIEGAVSLSAQLMNALILMNGHEVKPVEISGKRCVLNFKRKGKEDWVQFEYTLEDAKAAGYLHKNNWKTHPKDMLYCRCLSGGARKVFPDVIMGCYVHGELDNGELPSNSPIPEYEEVEYQEQEEGQEVQQVSFQKTERYEEFIKKHRLDEKNTKSDFVSEILKTSNKSRIEIINHACDNEEGFESAYNNWMEANGYTDSNNLEALEDESLEIQD